MNVNKSGLIFEKRLNLCIGFVIFVLEILVHIRMVQGSSIKRTDLSSNPFLGKIPPPEGAEKAKKARVM